MSIAEADATELYGLPLTTRKRTVLDCCGALRITAARTLFDRALQQQWITLGDVIRRLKDESGRHGNVQLRRLLDEASLGPFPARSHQAERSAGAGWSVLRYTWADLVERPEQVIRDIRGHLQRLVG